MSRVSVSYNFSLLAFYFMHVQYFETPIAVCEFMSCVVVRCSVLQCVAVCCSVLQCVAACLSHDTVYRSVLQCHVTIYL